MNLLPSSITLTNFVTVLCRIFTCDSQYDYPVNEADVVAANRVIKSFENENDLNAPVRQQDSPEVWTELGRVQGYYMTIVRGTRINAFEGIPYAETPGRFRDSVPAKPWNGTLDAKAIGPLCLQLHYGRIQGSEDGCLTLNIYTKDISPLKPYPVIIFIHGGFWLSGGGSQFGPAYLLDNDVILVTFNYRLGVLGFLSSGDEEALGNFGLKDQALLIKWVYENIANFGGDPKRITLTGSSAGAVSTHLHMISNAESRDKIASAISISGTAYNIWGLQRLNSSVTVSRHMANISGCPTNSGTKSMIECLRRVDGSMLVANQLLTFPMGYFIPSIEANLPGAFLTRGADEAYRLGKVARIPWIVSMTSRELNLPVTPLQANIIVSLLRAAFNGDLPNLLRFRENEVDVNKVRNSLIKYYARGSESVNDLWQEEFSRIATDRYFTVPIRKAIQMHSQIAPTYATLFNYSSELGRAGRLGFNYDAAKAFGILHGDDLIYFLNSTRHHPPIKRFDAHFAITKLLVNLYGSFAQFGEPLYFSEDNKQYRIWDVIQNPDKIKFLRIDEEVKMIEDPYEKTASFWESLGVPDMTSFFTLKK